MQPGDLLTAIVWSVLPAAILLAGIWAVDRYEKEPLRLVAIALGLGAVAAPLLAFVLQVALDEPTSMRAQTIIPESQLSVISPLIEAIALGLAILVVFLIVRHEIDDLLDGVLYGAVVGIGFALTANFVSILATNSQFGQETTPSLFAAMVAGLNYLFYGGVIGLAAGLGRRQSVGIAAGYIAIGVAAAYGFHLVHDYLPWWVAPDASGAASSAFAAFLADVPNLIGLVALGAILVWASGRQALIVGRELEEEVQNGFVAREEYATVTNSLRRFGVLARTLFTRGDDEWRARRRLYSLEVELAFRKHQRKSERVQHRKWLDEDHYRAAIAEVRADLAELGGVTAR
jgi:protease PrsW